MSITLYKVGGCVRDKIMGIAPKDIDFTVECSSFAEMEEYIKKEGGVIYQSKPEFLTIRAKVWGINADFVCCRQEGNYSDGRRPDEVKIGTILQDLSRRDFSINSIAEKVVDGVDNGEYIDPYNGVGDIAKKIIRCVGKPEDRFNEDPLRVLRAIRFAVTKEFLIDMPTHVAINDKIIKKLYESVSLDRIREELHRCFAHNSYMTIRYLLSYDLLPIFVKTDIWLKPTTEAKN